MGFVWNPIGLTGLAAGAAGITLAAIVYGAGPTRPVNRWLALLLFMEGGVQVMCAGGLGNFLDNPNHVLAVAGVDQVAYMTIPFLYLLFLGAAFDTPLVRPLRNRMVRMSLVLLMFVAVAIRLVFRDAFILGVGEPWYASYAPVYSALYLHYVRFYAALSVFAFIVAFDAYRRAKTPASKSQAKFYAWAFGIRDAFWIVVNLYVIPVADPGTSIFWGLFWTQGIALSMLAFIGLLGYGIVRTQMFDIDLKIKFALHQSTMAGAFLVLFFAVSEGIEALVSTRAGVAAGFGAAVALALASRPLHRATDRVTNHLMPGVHDTPDYRRERKREVYEAAIEGILLDASASKGERTILLRLQQRLGLSAEEATEIERRVAGFIAT